MSNMKNFYELLPDKYKTDRRKYENYDKVHIELPCRILICGTSGSYKTNTLFNIILSINNFTRIFIYAKEINEPLYKNLIEVMEALGNKMKRKIISYSDKIEDVPDPSDFDIKEKNLVIFDDLINEDIKKYQNVKEIFCRGRKRNISAIFISQSYFATPQIIRKNVNYVVLKKINGKRGLKSILSTHSLSLDVDDVLDIYKYVLGLDPVNFFMIDGLTKDPNLQFRCNFTGVIVD